VGTDILWNCIFYIDFTRPIQVMEMTFSLEMAYIWKVMEFIVLISRPGKSLNLSACLGNQWKSM